MIQYNPNTISVSKMKALGIDERMFLQCQQKYRESFESILKKYVSFERFDQKLENSGAIVLNDIDYNIYHKYSTLGSKYIFFRNNFHIENLSKEEFFQFQKYLFDETMLPLDFLQKTFLKVLFEEGHSVFVNSVVEKNVVLSKSFIFEIAYDFLKIEDVKQLKEIEKCIQSVVQDLKNIFEKKTNIPISVVVYTASPDIFKTKEKES